MHTVGLHRIWIDVTGKLRRESKITRNVFVSFLSPTINKALMTMSLILPLWISAPPLAARAAQVNSPTKQHASSPMNPELRDANKDAGKEVENSPAAEAAEVIRPAAPFSLEQTSQEATAPADKIYRFAANHLLTQKSQILTPPRPGSHQVIIFLSSRCPCSRSYTAYLEELHKRFPKFLFYGIVANQDEDMSQAAEFFRSHKLTFPVLVDAGARIADHFKALKTPHVFVVDSKGQVLYSGGIADRREAPSAEQFYLATILEHLNQGKPLPYTHQRTLGCYISRKGS